MFDFISTLNNPKDALDRANFAVQDKLGKFLSHGAHIIALRDKAANNPALVSQGTSLLNGIKTIQARALTVLSQAAALQNKLGVNPSLMSLDKSMLSQAADIAKSLYTINGDMDAHTQKINAYAAEVAGVVPASTKDYSWLAPVVGLVALGLFAMRKK